MLSDYSVRRACATDPTNSDIAMYPLSDHEEKPMKVDWLLHPACLVGLGLRARANKVRPADCQQPQSPDVLILA